MGSVRRWETARSVIIVIVGSTRALVCLNSLLRRAAPQPETQRRTSPCSGCVCDVRGSSCVTSAASRRRRRLCLRLGQLVNLLARRLGRLRRLDRPGSSRLRLIGGGFVGARVEHV